MKRTIIIAILPVLILGFMITNGHASSKDIKQRMIARLPVIKSLKDKGIVGENNQGYLEFIGKKKEKADVVQAENNDRKQVYEAIAKQQSTTVELVGKHRAIQIANKAETGDWLQDAAGKWYQKGK
jgi:uncharacterized protein YdbL (DUF1318 family)